MMLKVMGYKLKDKFISYEIKTMSNMYCCKHCNRAYKRKVYFDRHVIACEIMSKPKKQRDVEAQELSDTPTVRQLYDVILEMGKKMVDMEKQIEELNKWIHIKKQKIDILEWLNQQYTPRILFDDWIANMVVTDSHIARLEKANLFDSVVEIFRENISTNKDENAVRAFDKGNNILYTYTEDGWIKMAAPDMHKAMSSVHKKLLKKIVAWQKPNIEDCKNATIREKNEMLYNTYIKKCMMAKLSGEQLSQRMSNLLHKLIKQNMKDIVQYELAF